MSLGGRIKEIRLALGWTQDKLAQESGISKSFLSEIENDKANISGENLLKLADVLNTSLDYLMKGTFSETDEQKKLVEIPKELSDASEELGLSYKATLSLLSAHQALIARRTDRERLSLSKEKWKELYLKLKGYIE